MTITRNKLIKVKNVYKLVVGKNKLLGFHLKLMTWYFYFTKVWENLHKVIWVPIKYLRSFL